MMAQLQIDGVSAIAVIVIASFGVDRITKGVKFLLGYFPAFARRFPEPTITMNSKEYEKASRQHKMIYFVLAAFLSCFIVWRLEIRIFEAVGFKYASATTQENQTNSEEESGFISKVAGIFPSAESWRKFLDGIFTALILVGGADRITALLKIPAGEKSEPSPIEVKGKFIVVDDNSRKIGLKSETH